MPRKANFSKLVKEDSAKVYKEIATFENYSNYIPNCSSAKLIEKNDSLEIGELQFNFFLKNYLFVENFENLFREKNVEIVDLVKSFPTRIWSPKSASIQKRKDRLKFEIEKWGCMRRLEFVR